MALSKVVRGCGLFLFAGILAFALIPLHSARGAESTASGATVQAGNGVTIESLDPSKPLAIDGKEYRGGFRFTRSGGLNVTNVVSIEDYIKGISEVPNSWPQEALRAQAIAARTYVAWQLQSRETICATDSCQVYGGVHKEKSAYGANWVAAVDATASQVLLYNGRPIKAMYSSSNGGLERKGTAPYLWQRPDPDDAASPLHKWSYVASLSTIKSVNGIPANASTAVAGSGLAFSFAGQQRTLDGPTLRRQINGNFGAPSGRSLPVPSNMFSTSVSGDQISISGGGYGHGIGMSQYGALGKARRGVTADRILSSYYGGIYPTPGNASVPTEVKVDLGVRASANVVANGPFRVRSANGQTLSVGRSGSWNVTPNGAGITLHAANTMAQANLQSITIESLPTTKIKGTLLFNLDQPAVVRLQMLSTSGKELLAYDLAANDISKADTPEAEAFRSHGVAPAGRSRILIPETPSPGSFEVRLTAVNGAGSPAVRGRVLRVAPKEMPSVAPVDLWQPAVALAAPHRRSALIGGFLVLIPWGIAGSLTSAAFRSRRARFRP